MSVKIKNHQEKPVVISNGRRQVKLYPDQSVVVPGEAKDWPGLYGVVIEDTESPLTSATGTHEVREGKWKCTNMRRRPLIMVYRGQHAKLYPKQSVVFEGDYFELAKNYGLCVVEVPKEEEDDIPTSEKMRGVVLVQSAEEEDVVMDGTTKESM